MYTGLCKNTCVYKGLGKYVTCNVDIKIIYCYNTRVIKKKKKENQLTIGLLRL